VSHLVPKLNLPAQVMVAFGGWQRPEVKPLFVAGAIIGYRTGEMDR
jgi:hypothetical protein